MLAHLESHRLTVEAKVRGLMHQYDVAVEGVLDRVKDQLLTYEAATETAVLAIEKASAE
jgi:hypothetical protein